MPVFFDVETQDTFQDVGGRYPDRLSISVAVSYNTADQAFHRYTEAEVPALVAELQAADLVVGYNLYGFDYPVVMRYTDVNLHALPSVDMLDVIYKRLGFRVGLDAVASATLGTGKSADGLQAVRWWREGKVETVFEYCEQDVAVTRDVYNFGKRHRYVQFYDRQYRLKKVPVSW